MNEQETLIKEQEGKLPLGLRQALQVVPWKEAIKDIALANKLSLPQISLFDQETMLILYGFDDPKNYIDNLVKEVGVDENTAVTIAEAVQEKILKPIAAKASKFAESSTSSPSSPSENLPVVEKGEVAHDVPHVETPASPTQPTEKPKPVIPKTDYRYPDGKDPYREPTV